MSPSCHSTSVQGRPLVVKSQTQETFTKFQFFSAVVSKDILQKCFMYQDQAQAQLKTNTSWATLF